MIFNMIAAGGGSGGRPMAYGTVTGTTGTGASVASGVMTISGLPFRPVILFVFEKAGFDNGYEFAREYNEETKDCYAYWADDSDGSVNVIYPKTGQFSSITFEELVTITDTGVTLNKKNVSGYSGFSSTATYYWYAFGVEG